MLMTMNRYDFSILTLAQPVTFTAAVNPACLPWNVDEDYTGHVIMSTIYLQISTNIYHLSTNIYTLYLQKSTNTYHLSTNIYTYLRVGGHRHRVGHDHLRRQPAQRPAGGQRDRDLQHPVRERVRLQRGRVSH